MRARRRARTSSCTTQVAACLSHPPQSRTTPAAGLSASRRANHSGRRPALASSARDKPSGASPRRRHLRISRRIRLRASSVRGRPPTDVLPEPTAAHRLAPSARRLQARRPMCRGLRLCGVPSARNFVTRLPVAVFVRRAQRGPIFCLQRGGLLQPNALRIA